MTTVRDVVTLGLQLARVVPLGRDPKAKESDTGLTILQGMYDAMFADGMFGRMTDVFKDENYTAQEGERIYNDGATITIPTTITNDGDERAPRDLSAITVIASGVTTNRVYSSGAWETCSALTLSSDAPLATRNMAGLAALLATTYANMFGSQVMPETREMGQRFKGSIAYKLGSTQDDKASVYY